MRLAVSTIAVLCLLGYLVPEATAERYSTLSGRLVAEDSGEGLAEYMVRAMPGDYRALTDESGNFLISGLSPDSTYQMSFFREDSPYVNEYSSLEVYMPKDRFFITLTHSLNLGAAISGTVYDSDGVTPMSGAAVTATSTGSQNWMESERLTRTDLDGRYLIQGLPETERCVIGVAVYGHAWIEKTLALKSGVTLGHTDFVIKWDDLTGIRGRVVFSEKDVPVVNARVLLIDAADRTVGIALTNNAGVYELVGVTPGLYTAVVTWRGESAEKQGVVVEEKASSVVDFTILEGGPPGEAGGDT